MLKKWIALLTGIVFIVAAFGCATMEKASTFNGLQLTAENKDNVAHYNGKNWGIYLLSIPLITGNTEKLSSVTEEGIVIATPALLKDTVSLDSVAEMVTRTAKADGAEVVEDMVSTTKNVWIFPLLVIFYRGVQISANGVK